MIDLALLTHVANVLAHKDVTVRLRAPCVRNCKGLSMARPGGVTIDLDPAMNLGQFYWTFLHECGHAKDQPKVTTPNDWIDKPSGYFMITKDFSHPVVNLMEAAADRQAQKWDAWASSWAGLYQGATSEERRLRALLNWAPNTKSFTELLDDASQAADEILDILRR